MAINYTSNVCQKCVQSQPLVYFVLLVCRKKTRFTHHKSNYASSFLNEITNSMY